MPSNRIPENTTTVYDYFTFRLGNASSVEAAEKVFSTEDKEEYKTLELYCPVGESCRNVIDAAFNLLVVCDKHHDVVNHILSAAKIAIDIYWFG